MQQPSKENPHNLRVSPAERRDRELTTWGWSLMGCLFFANLALDLSEPTLAIIIFLIVYTVNIARLVKGFRVHFLSLAIGLISAVHGFFAFIEVEFAWWYPVGAAVLLYGAAKLILREKIR